MLVVSSYQNCLNALVPSRLNQIPTGNGTSVYRYGCTRGGGLLSSGSTP